MEVISHAISDSPRPQKTMFLHRLNTRQSRRRGKVDGNQVGGTYYVKQVNPGTIGASERSHAIPGSLGRQARAPYGATSAQAAGWCLTVNRTPHLCRDQPLMCDFSLMLKVALIYHTLYLQMQVHSLGVK